jgi:hypothetical protein
VLNPEPTAHAQAADGKKRDQQSPQGYIAA